MSRARTFVRLLVAALKDDRARGVRARGGHAEARDDADAGGGEAAAAGEVLAGAADELAALDDDERAVRCQRGLDAHPRRALERGSPLTIAAV